MYRFQHPRNGQMQQHQAEKTATNRIRSRSNQTGNGVIRIKIFQLLLAADKPVTVTEIRENMHQNGFDISRDLVAIVLSEIAQCHISITETTRRVHHNKMVPAYFIHIKHVLA